MRLERERLGFSQDRAGEITGVSRRGYINYEIELTSPTVDWLARFAQAGANLDYLLYGHEPSDTEEPFRAAEFEQAMRFTDEHCRDAKGRPMSIAIRIEQTLHIYRFLVAQKGGATKAGLAGLAKMMATGSDRKR
jgi:transcriptional regulator with XRE-family HTH domain